MADLKLVNIYKVYDKTVEAVHDFNLEIADQEFVVLVGPSGCGKSTTLRMIAGLESITGGELYIGGRLVNDVPPKDRDISMVFQNYALYPHMTVYENMAYSLKLRKFPKKLIDEKVRAAAEILDITELLERKPKALSGGQRQRVAIGRSIVRKPSVFLMDEPLSNLDAKLRNQMRAELLKLHRNIKTTFVYVTHDQTEAMTLGDRIVIMDKGYIQQVGSPTEVFFHPANRFVAGFIGSPPMNFFEARLERSGSVYQVELCGHRISLPAERQARLAARDVSEQEVVMGVRPAHLSLCPAGQGLAAAVDVAEMMGLSIQLHVKVQGKDTVVLLEAGEQQTMPWHVGEEVDLAFDAENLHLFSAETGDNLEPCSPAPAAAPPAAEAPEAT